MQIKVTEQLLNTFRENNLFFTANGTDRFKIGDTLNYLPSLRVEPYAGIFGGNFLYSIGSFSYSWSAWTSDTTIGRYSSVAGNVRSMSVQHPTNRFTTSSVTYDSGLIIFKKAREATYNDSFRTVGAGGVNNKPISIGNDVWIGGDVTIKQGVKINDGAVVGAHAVVTKDVPSYAIVGGVPAKVLKYRFADNIIDELLKLKWWEYSFADFRDMRSDIDIFHFIGRVKEEVEKGILHKFAPHILSAAELTPPPPEID